MTGERMSERSHGLPSLDHSDIRVEVDKCLSMVKGCATKHGVALHSYNALQVAKYFILSFDAHSSMVKESGYIKLSQR